MRKKRNQNVLLYIFIVLLPTFLGMTYYVNDSSKDDLKERTEDAKWVASIHESHWNQFISETVTSLKTLSLTAGTLLENPKEMEPLLKKAHLTDPRYSGLYLLNRDGFVITGSNDFLSNQGSMEKNYIKEVIQTKDIIVSNRPCTLDNGQRVIGIASPVLDESGDLIEIMVALLRLDYVENIMNVLTPEAKLFVIADNEEVIMTINTKRNERFHSDEWISYPVELLPWDIKVKLSNSNSSIISLNTLMVAALLLVITHILFLLIKYMVLKRQALIEKKENESQKLELVGTLAASTAHEIRNPLTGIRGLVQLLSEKHNDKEDQFYFSVIHEEINRINEIVSEFLILGKPTVQRMKTEDLSAILKELQPLISSEAKLNNVNWTMSMPSKPVNVNCTKDQMKQVILNITRNAFEAMEDSGNLHIQLTEKNNCGELIIKDDGIGIPKDQIENIFHPFYTSKETGTGLGLVVCNRILQSFDGKIQIVSKEKKGTTVTITLPIIR